MFRENEKSAARKYSGSGESILAALFNVFYDIFNTKHCMSAV